MASQSPSPFDPNEVRPYRINVSQKYLELTRKKLELTRLPREPTSSQPASNFGVAKSQVEPIVDEWLEDYDWRAQEAFLNKTLPQYRTSVNGTTRIHFVHRKSDSSSALPLLLVYGWPETFIGGSKLLDSLCNPIRTPPKGSENTPSFHVVIPSIPGFGFSDAVAEGPNNVQATADAFDALMKRLGYSEYICHGTGWGLRICRILALAHRDSCVAIHTVNPDVPAPRSTMGYSPDDLTISGLSLGTPNGVSPAAPSGARETVRERPQTAAYALCDSPTGLLAHIVDSIGPPAPSASTINPEQQREKQPLALGNVSTPWTPSALITWTMLYWLPGPEVPLRWLVNSAALVPSLWTSHSKVPIGITHFRDPAVNGQENGTEGPPQWAEAFHRVAMVKRREGRVRFASWERPQEVVADLREFAGVLTRAKDGRG